MAEISFPSFTDQFGLKWPRTELMSIAWSHPGQRYHPTPGEESGVLISRADGFHTGVLQIYGLPRYLMNSEHREKIAMWLAQLDIQANTTRIPHKRNAFALVGKVKIAERTVSKGIYTYSLPSSGSDKEQIGDICEIDSGKDVAKRILRITGITDPGGSPNTKDFTFHPNIKLPATVPDGAANATVIKTTSTILTRALNERPILDPRTANAAGPWVYAWKEVLH